MNYNKDNPEIFQIRITKNKEDGSREVILIDKDKNSGNLFPIYSNLIETFDKDNNRTGSIVTTDTLLVNQFWPIQDIILLFSFAFNSACSRKEEAKKLKIIKRKKIDKFNKPNVYKFKYHGLKIKIEIMITTTIMVTFEASGRHDKEELRGFNFDLSDKLLEMTIIGNEDHISWMLGWNNAMRIIDEFFTLDDKITFSYLPE